MAMQPIRRHEAIVADLLLLHQAFIAERDESAIPQLCTRAALEFRRFPTAGEVAAFLLTRIAKLGALVGEDGSESLPADKLDRFRAAYLEGEMGAFSGLGGVPQDIAALLCPGSPSHGALASAGEALSRINVALLHRQELGAAAAGREVLRALHGWKTIRDGADPAACGFRLVNDVDDDGPPLDADQLDRFAAVLQAVRPAVGADRPYVRDLREARWAFQQLFPGGAGRKLGRGFLSEGRFESARPFMGAEAASPGFREDPDAFETPFEGELRRFRRDMPDPGRDSGARTFLWRTMKGLDGPLRGAFSHDPFEHEALARLFDAYGIDPFAPPAFVGRRLALSDRFVRREAVFAFLPGADGVVAVFSLADDPDAEFAVSLGFAGLEATKRDVLPQTCALPAAPADGWSAPRSGDALSPIFRAYGGRAALFQRHFVLRARIAEGLAERSRRLAKGAAPDPSIP